MIRLLDADTLELLWAGSEDELLAANDDLEDDLERIRADLERDGYSIIGGGAAAAFRLEREAS